MDLEEARALLRRSQAERQSAQEMVRVGQATIESSQWIIKGILTRYPELGDEEQEWGDVQLEYEEEPRGDKAILAVLQELEENWFSVNDMVVTLRNRGIVSDSPNAGNAVRTALERLRSGIRGVEKAHIGAAMRYRFREVAATDEMRSEAASGGYGYDEEPF
jgi:hypothetical protein